MSNVRMNLGRSLVMVGFSAVLASTGGCATTSGSSTAMTPAEAEQVASEECVGVPQNERDKGLLAYRDAISGTRPLMEKTHVGKIEVSRERGVVLAVRAKPGMSAPWLGRIASCHIALEAASGSAGASNTDPQLVPGATVRVEEAFDGYLVSIRAPDDAAASETIRRTQAFLTGPSGPATAQR